MTHRIDKFFYRDPDTILTAVLGGKDISTISPSKPHQFLQRLFIKTYKKYIQIIPKLSEIEPLSILSNPLSAWAPWLITEDLKSANNGFSSDDYIALASGMLIDLGRPELAVELFPQGCLKWLFAFQDSIFILRRDSNAINNSSGLQEIILFDNSIYDSTGIRVHGKDKIAEVSSKLIIEQFIEGEQNIVLPLSYDIDPDEVLFKSLTQVHRALTVLAQQDFISWIQVFLDRIVVIASKSSYSGRYSVCGPEVPSLAFIDARGSLLDVVESIVHEASHQQLYFLELGEPLLLQHILAPSPFRSTLRSLRRVLAGAHAYANSIYVIESCIKNLDSVQCQGRLELLRKKLFSSLEILDRHDSLSNTARQIIEQIKLVHEITLSTQVVIPITIVPKAEVELNKKNDGYNPWSWLISKRGWHLDLIQRIRDWSSKTFNDSSAQEIRSTLIAAATRSEEWLYHPCMKPLFYSNGRLSEEIGMFAWSALHTNLLNHIEVTLNSSLLLWTPNGGHNLDAGNYNGEELKNLYGSGSPIEPFAVDAFASFLDITPEVPDTSSEFLHELVELCTTLANLATISPDVIIWIASVTKVLTLPLKSERSSLRSFCRADVPGCIYLEIFADPISTGELLVHESAHLNLFLAEANNLLVKPDHKQLYWSPLRKDPRPLRGILLAYHALSYISAFYRTIIESSWSTSNSELLLTQTVHKAKLAQSVLDGARLGLTESGKKFIQQTKEVLTYAAS